MKGHNENTEIIIAYLEEQRKKDDQLDEAMNKAEENGKTSDAMWGYIFNKAKENLGGQSGAVESGIYIICLSYDNEIVLHHNDYIKANKYPPHLITLIGRFYESLEEVEHERD